MSEHDTTQSGTARAITAVAEVQDHAALRGTRTARTIAKAQAAILGHMFEAMTGTMAKLTAALRHRAEIARDTAEHGAHAAEKVAEEVAQTARTPVAKAATPTASRARPGANTADGSRPG